MTILSENGNELAVRDLFNEVEKRVSLTDWDRARYEKTGYIRWESILHFYSIDCIKAGFLIKKSGVWYLTPDGTKSLGQKPEDLLRQIQAAYLKWKSEQPLGTETVNATEPDEPEPEQQEEAVLFSDMQEKALEGLERFINTLNPYEFQDLVAALLRGMGYFTPFVAPRGKDGGVDIIAYRDPLGTQSPRIQVQIKHREKAAIVSEIRELMGLLQKDGDVGIFVSTGGFTQDARTTARSSHVHVELIDQNRFFDLWQTFYDKLPEQDKRLMPLRPIWFLATEE